MRALEKKVLPDKGLKENPAGKCSRHPPPLLLLRPFLLHHLGKLCSEVIVGTSQLAEGNLGVFLSALLNQPVRGVWDKVGRDAEETTGYDLQPCQQPPAVQNTTFTFETPRIFWEPGYEVANGICEEAAESKHVAYNCPQAPSVVVLIRGLGKTSTEVSSYQDI